MGKGSVNKLNNINKSFGGKVVTGKSENPAELGQNKGVKRKLEGQGQLRDNWWNFSDENSEQNSNSCSRTTTGREQQQNQIKEINGIKSHLYHFFLLI